MANTLKEQMEADLDDVFLDEDEFAEKVFYAPAGGGPVRSFSAVWDPGEQRSDTPLGIEDVERGWLWCKRHGTEGIDQPQLGDRLWIESEGVSMADELAWSYAGDTDDDDGRSWSLMFSRRRVDRMGGNHV